MVASALFQPLVGKALGAGCDIDDAAVLESVFEKVVLHNQIVTVGVDADIVRDPVQVLHHYIEHAPDLRQFRHPVNHIIGLVVIQPGTIVNAGISGIRGRDAGEIGHDAPILLHHLPIPRADVPPHHLFGGVTFGPLVGIARGQHDVTPRFQHLHDGGKVRKRCVFQLKHKYKYTKIG